MKRSKVVADVEGTAAGDVEVSVVEDGSVVVAPVGEAMVWRPVVNEVGAVGNNPRDGKC